MVRKVDNKENKGGGEGKLKWVITVSDGEREGLTTITNLWSGAGDDSRIGND